MPRQTLSMRILVVFVWVLAIVAGSAGVAAAADPPARPGAAAAGEADDDGFAATPCPQPIEIAVRATVPASVKISCRMHKTSARRVDRQVIAGTIDAYRAEAVQPDGRIARLELTKEGKVTRLRYSHSDVVASSGWGMALLFWAFALASVVGALFVVTRRNLIAAVMGMVGSFLGVAAIYMMLYASFLAVIQVVVYAGAIMVLFVFVVMILNRPEDEPVAPSGRAGQALGGVAIVYLVARLIMMLVRVQPPNPEVAMAAPPALPPHCVAWQNHVCVETARHEWGSLGAVGSDLFNGGLFPFEAISVLLLVAVVGAIAIARPLQIEEDEPARKRQQGGVA